MLMLMLMLIFEGGGGENECLTCSLIQMVSPTIVTYQLSLRTLSITMANCHCF